MKQQYLPDIGSVGNFTLKAPYDTLIKPKVSYRCKSLRLLSECIADGLDPFAYYYESVGLTQTDFNKDLEDDVSIVSLQTDSGEWLYIPSSYILQFPNMNGIVYRAMLLSMSLGALPDTMKLDALKTALSNLITDTIGVTPIIKEIVVSVPAIVSKDDHDMIEAARNEKIVIISSDAAKLNQANQDLDRARARILELENYIKTKL